jgi:hypothetical protein
MHAALEIDRDYATRGSSNHHMGYTPSYTRTSTHSSSTASSSSLNSHRDRHENMSKAEKQRRLFAAAKERAKHKQQALTSKNAALNESIYKAPSFFRDETEETPYRNEERMECIAMIVKEQTDAYRCLCIASKYVMPSDNAECMELLSHHYRRLARLTHPDKHMQDEQSRSNASQAMKILNEHYSTLKKTYT